MLLNKPAGITSFDAVAACRRFFHEKRVGHTGTLDPNASGLMIILLGSDTKLVPYCMKNEKAYHAGFSFGTRTDTEDIWGKPVETRIPGQHTIAEMQAVLNTFIGTTMQMPPMYSAIKKDGKKLYEYARKGIEVQRQPRPIVVSSAQVSEAAANEYVLDAVVSSGTYIRTLITDYAAKLGELAVMTSLVRTAIGRLKLADACTLEQLSEQRFLNPAEVIDPEIPLIESEDLADIRNGRPLHLNCTSDLVIVTHHGQIAAAYHLAENGVYYCQRGLA